MSLPQWMNDLAQEKREASGRQTGARLASALILIAAAFCVVLAFLPENDPRVWFTLMGGFASVPLLGALLGWTRERTAARLRTQGIERLETLGETTLDGDFVGVSYADGAWTYPGLGTSADEGILRIDLDRLAFVGRQTRFDLRASAVVATEVRRHDPGLVNQARLYVAWAEGGSAGILSLALPYRRSLRRRVAEARELRERIDRWRAEPFPCRAAPTTFPPFIEPIAKVSPYNRIGLPAKVLAGIATFATLFAFFSGVEFLTLLTTHHGVARRLGGSVGVLYPFGLLAWITLALKIEPKLPERYRYRDPDTVLEPQRLGTERAQDGSDRVSLGRKSDL